MENDISHIIEKPQQAQAEKPRRAPRTKIEYFAGVNEPAHIFDAAKLKILPVLSRFDIRAFHDLPKRLYQGIFNWVPPLYSELENTFSKRKNHFFQSGTCQRFLIRYQDRVVARFALMERFKSNGEINPKHSGIGYLEFENHQEILDHIIAFARDWFTVRGHATFVGPIHFGSNENFWGVQVENFERTPVHAMPYHHAYYHQLIEATGAEKLLNHHSFSRPIDEPLPQYLIVRAERALKRHPVKLRPLRLNQLADEMELIHEAYVTAWSNQHNKERNESRQEIPLGNFVNAAKKARPVLLEYGNYVATIDDKVVAFALTVPDLYELSREVGGRIYPWHLKKAYSFKNRANRLRLLVLGTVPEYRGIGIEAAIFIEGIRQIRRHHPNIKHLHSSWISDDNQIMLNTIRRLGFDPLLTHRTYQWEV
jgi:GNAT superfamily N-acetyltransferase